MPLEIDNAEPIIGLSATNFKRTIIIPQGKFKEFIELKGTDRTNMMKELFNLHHYDLANNTRTLFIENAKKLDKLEGRLSGYEDISKEIVTEKQSFYRTTNKL